jgi:hypothetical protein
MNSEETGIALARASDTSLGLAPLGIPLRIDFDRADDRAVIQATCRGWDGVPGPGERELRIVLEHADDLAGTGSTEVSVTGRDMRLHGSGAAGSASADAGVARCAVSAEFLAAPELLREHVLEPLLLFLLARNGRTPIHAAGFVAEGLAILAAGPSGAGKSSLALAADAAGWPVLSEDTVYLQTHPGAKVWGWPGPVHLLPGDGDRAALGTRLRGGKLKQALALGTARQASAESATLCLLERGERVSLDRIESAEALRRLAPLEPGFDLLAREIEQAHALLTRKGAWLLTLSSRPAEAIALLSATLPLLRETAVP